MATLREGAIAQSFVVLALASSMASCTFGRRLVAANYGVGVADEIWTGVYEVPGTGEVGSVVAQLRQFADIYSGQFAFKNETYNFVGAGELKGQLRSDQTFELAGTLSDTAQGPSVILLEGKRAQDTMEGTYQQTFGAQAVAGRFLLVRLSRTTYVGGFRSHQVTAPGRDLLDLGADPSGLLGPARPDAYGPGIHADSTGRPFRWRAEDGSTVLGDVRPNTYGPGIGSDATGRPVHAAPAW